MAAAARRSALALPLLAAAGLACARARPAGPGAGPLPSDASPAAALPAAPPFDPAALERRAQAAWEARGAEGAADEAGRAFEELAARAVDPFPHLLAAARARRHATEALLSRAAAAGREAPPGAQPAELLSLAAAQARACSADARQAWGARHPAAVRALEAGGPAAAALAGVQAPEAEALYLDALCAAAWARTQGFTQLVERREELAAALERAAALAPGLDDAGPDRALGTLLAQLPDYAGGDVTRARVRFEAALERAPGAVRTRVQYARTVALKLLDRPLFDRLLDEALSAQPGSPEERVAQEEGRALKARAEAIFGAR